MVSVDEKIDFHSGLVLNLGLIPHLDVLLDLDIDSVIDIGFFPVAKKRFFAVVDPFFDSGRPEWIPVERIIEYAGRPR